MNDNEPKKIPRTQEELFEYAYERYKMDWLLSHGFTMSDVLKSIVDYLNDLNESGDYFRDQDFAETISEWEDDVGLAGGQIWACREEFRNEEYQDASYMRRLLTKRTYAAYTIRHCMPSGTSRDGDEWDGTPNV